MRQLTKIQKGIIFIGLFFTGVYFCVPSTNYSNCFQGEEFRQVEFEGVVTRKYIDKSDHSVPKVELRNAKNSIDKIFLLGDRSGLFERITDGDSLKKYKGTMEVLKKVNNKYLGLGYVDFSCDSTKLKKEEYLFWIYELTGQH